MLFLADVGWSRVRVSSIDETGKTLAATAEDAYDAMDEVLAQLTVLLSSLGCADRSRVALAWNGVVANGCVHSSGRGSADVAGLLHSALGSSVQVWNDAHAAGWSAVTDHAAREAVIAVIGSSLGRAYVANGRVVETPGAGELLSVSGCSCGEEQCIRELPGGVRFARHVATTSGVVRTNQELRQAWDDGDEIVRESFLELWGRVRLSVFEPAVLTGAESVFLGGSFGAAWFDVIRDLWTKDEEKLTAEERHAPRCVAIGTDPVLGGLACLVCDETRWR